MPDVILNILCQHRKAHLCSCDLFCYCSGSSGIDLSVSYIEVV